MKAYLKAIYGAVIAGLGALQVALNPVAGAPVQVTFSEWVGVVVAAVIALGVIWAVPNSPPS